MFPDASLLTTRGLRVVYISPSVFFDFRRVMNLFRAIVVELDKNGKLELLGVFPDVEVIAEELLN